MYTIKVNVAAVCCHEGEGGIFREVRVLFLKNGKKLEKERFFQVAERVGIEPTLAGGTGQQRF